MAYSFFNPLRMLRRAKKITRDEGGGGCSGGNKKKRNSVREISTNFGNLFFYLYALRIFVPAPWPIRRGATPTEIAFQSKRQVACSHRPGHASRCSAPGLRRARGVGPRGNSRLVSLRERRHCSCNLSPLAVDGAEASASAKASTPAAKPSKMAN